MNEGDNLPSSSSEQQVPSETPLGPNPAQTPAVSNTLNDFIKQAAGVLLNPKTFFASIPPNENYMRSGTFLAISYGIFTVLSAITEKDPMRIPFWFVGGLLGYGVLTAVFHIVAAMLGGKATKEQSFAIISYSSATNLLGWLPMIGIPIRFYALYILVVGVMTLHQLPQRKAVACVFIPMFFGIMVTIVSIVDKIKHLMFH